MTSFERSLKDLIESQDLNFYGIENIKENDRNIFRVLIKSPKGTVSIDDCVRVSNVLSPFLDVEEPMRGEYNLEVSSPGIERKVETMEHFRLSIGEKFEIKTRDDSVYKGVLKSVSNDELTVDDKSIGDIAISFSEIKKAKTYFDFK